ncbi:holo-[acyl-carrier-protein] synthase [Anaplasma platys]|uniref:Holo-[acyl-carrier-protein] synthase n=1 Tax=Anaplasma platys TaxID=949 RepID=A0A858PYB0_9RICK|nr:holo-[acyl-carrier-protein] synthase [Anaplasma platys]QJC27548.1 holo-[acyl-carrier-protein] synthase [Anaplasma platys]
MILGIGVDLVLIERIRAILNKHGKRFLAKVFSDGEIQDSLRYTNEGARVRHFAKRFAAKEAYVKAIGTGFGGEIESRYISVSNDKYGKPSISILGHKSQEHSVALSMSDDGDYAIAFVTIYSK